MLSSRITRALSGVAGLVAVGALGWAAAPADAVPATVSAVLTFHGVQTADAPGGTGMLTVAPGDSIRFSIERPDRISQAAGYWVVLDTHAFEVRRQLFAAAPFARD